MPPYDPGLQQLSDLDRDSPQFHVGLSNFFGGNVYQNLLSRLNSEDLAWLVEYLGNVLVDTPNHASVLFRESLHELGRVCGAKEALPRSCTLSESLLGCVYEGTFDGSKVRIRRLRVYPGEDPHKVKEVFHRIAAMSNYLAHPNIVPILGVTTEPLELISDWMPGGELPEYVATYPDADKHSLLSDVAEGLNYLHSCNVIHGDLKGSNILVDAAGRARITDFGLVTVTQDLGSIRNTSADHNQSVRWIAPEVLDEHGTYSKEADVFSFAGAMFEAFTGSVPFSDKSPCTAILAITAGERPSRPADPTLTESLWELMKQCWSEEAHLRPRAPQISHGFDIPAWKCLIDRPLTSDERISLITEIFSDRNEIEVVRNLRGRNAQSFVNVIHEMLDRLAPELRRECLRTLCKICGKEALLPRSIQIPLCYDPTSAPLYYGGSSEVWKGQHEGREVAVKVLRTHGTGGSDKMTHKFCKEVLAWKALCHPNVLPLLGVTMGARFTMVSEWMVNGNINEFIKTHKNANRFELLADVTHGLMYVHNEGIIHGDLKGANILINKHGRACLADFGLITIISDFTHSSTSTSTNGGTTRWMSPELLNPEQLGSKESQPTKESDCYALGMVIYEVLSRKAPFSSYDRDFVVSRKVIEGERPRRPSGTARAWFTDNLWIILEQCWLAQPKDRPTTKTVLGHLEQILKTWQPLPPSLSQGHSPLVAGQAIAGTVVDLLDPKSESLEQSLAAKKPPTSTGRNSKGNSGSKGFSLTAGGSDRLQGHPVPIGPEDSPTLISMRNIANWDRNSPDTSKVLTAFKTDDYLDCLAKLEVFGIDPLLFVNNLDKIIDSLIINSDLWRECVKALRMACFIHEILPTSYEITFKFTKPHGQPECSNGFSDIWRLAKKDERNQVFAVKWFHASRFCSVSRLKKEYCWIAAVSKKMEHPNILSIDGVAPKLSTFCLVSMWMANGNMLEYIKKHQEVNRLELLIGITGGLGYLHQNWIVYEHLKSSNILIDPMGNPLLSCFGLLFIRTPNNSNSTPGFSIRYTAPELLDTNQTTKAKKSSGRKSDIYSLSMIIVELATGQAPFSGVVDSDVMVMASSGKRPQKPRRFDVPGITAEVWTVAEKCWHEKAEERPEAKAVLQDLEWISGSGTNERHPR